VPLFQEGDAVFLHNLAMMLKPVVYSPGDYIIRQGETGREMYFICRGKADVLDGTGKRLNTLGEGDFFGEVGLLLAKPRTASIRATEDCDLFVLDKADFNRVLKDHPQFASCLRDIAEKRYKVVQD
jgi:CRP-like cAMP-binding protein